MDIAKRLGLQRDAAFWATALFILFVFLLGGSARADAASLVVLRPLAFLFLAYAVSSRSQSSWRDYPFLTAIIGFTLALVLLHLLPLPPALWQSLPGRGLISEIDAAAGTQGTWRPITISPQDGLNAALALVVPLAAFAAAARLTSTDRARLAYIFPVVACVGIVLGLLQIQGSNSSPFYFYRVTNDGKMVGLFANRNHFAVLLATMLPFLSYLASTPVRDSGCLQVRILLLVCGGLAVFATLVVIGSRAGFLLALVASIMATIIYRKPEIKSRRHSDRSGALPWAAKYGRHIVFAGVAAMAASFLFLAQSETMRRLAGTDTGEELRLKVVVPILEMGWKYFPFGSGVGSFVEAYKIDEPSELLNARYLNHAHNDPLEVYLTLGVPGVLLMVVAAVVWLRSARKVFARKAGASQEVALGRLGAAVTALLALASFLDYPLRTPSLSVLFMVAAVWLARGTQAATR